MAGHRGGSAVLPFFIEHQKIELAAKFSKQFNADVTPDNLILVEKGCRIRYTPEDYNPSQAGHAPFLGGAATVEELAALLGVSVEELLAVCWPHFDSIVLSSNSVIVLAALMRTKLGFLWREGPASGGFAPQLAALECFDSVVMPGTAANEQLHQMVGHLKPSPNPAKLAEPSARVRLEFRVQHPAVDFGAASGEVLADAGEQYQVEAHEEVEGEGNEDEEDEGDETEF